MSTNSIQAQLGYTAQASPVPQLAPVQGERGIPSQIQTDRIGEPLRAAKNAQPQIPTPSERKPVTDLPQPELKHMTRKTDVDWQTNQLVYRVIDNRSGQVVSQSPDEALLRLRAYAKQADTQSAAEQFVPHSVSREL